MRFEQRAPRALIEYLELAYLLCYAVVPAGFACLLLAGYAADALDTFWSVVLLAAFGCYGVLPWLPTRAPRAIEPPATRDALVDQEIESGGVESRQRAVEHVPKRPYGGVIGDGARGGHSYAPRRCACSGVVAVSIAAGSIVGRYHYAADAIIGAAVAVLAFVTATVVRGL